MVTATYLGKGRARIQSGERGYSLSQRTYLDELDAGLCPVELVAASLAG